MSMLNALRFIFLMSIVTWVGMIIFYTLFVTPSIFRALPRELAGDVVSHIFPKYWGIGYVAAILSLASLIAMSFIEKVFPMARILILALMTALTFYSGLVVAPEAQTVKAQMKVVEDPQRLEELRSEFRGVHRTSFAMNLVVMVAGVVLVFLVSRNLRL